MNGMNNVSEEFDSQQLKEIELGKEAGVDVSVYAKVNYLPIQMRELRRGLEEGLDVSIYANPAYDWFQMEEIRKGMKSGLDVALYAEPDIDFQKMRVIRHGLEKGINLIPYKKLKAGILEELRQSIMHKVALVDFINEGYDVEQLREIRYALEKKIDIKPYITNEFRGAAIREIAKALEAGLDPSAFDNLEYNWQQMREIRRGMLKRLDYNQYSNSLYNYKQMYEIRCGLEEGLDVSKYKSFMYDYKTMRQKRIELEKRKNEVVKHKDDIKSKLLPKGISISIEENGMKAYLVITKITEVLPAYEAFVDILKENRIVSGINYNKIRRFLDGEILENRILIAEGKFPTRGKDGYYEYMFETTIDNKISFLDDKTIDYENINIINEVKQGELIAKYHKAMPGTDGYTVLGLKLPASSGKELEVIKGNGFILTEGGTRYLASMNGIVQLVDEKLSVIPLLELDEVTNLNGNIDFDGCVHVKGSVSGDVLINATGDILIDGMLQSASLKSGGNILIKKGSNGGFSPSNSTIVCEGNLASGYLESTSANVKKNIFINYCLNSVIFAEGRIVVNGLKGRIVGGKTQAINGILAQYIGNEAGVTTEVRIDLADCDKERLSKLKTEIEEAKKQLELLIVTYKKYVSTYSAEVRNAMPVFLKIEDAIYTKNLDIQNIFSEIKVLTQKENRIKDAEIYARGIMYTGTRVCIDTARLDVETTYNTKYKGYKGRLYCYRN